MHREQWGKARSAYALDHFLPQAFHPEHALRYENLLYSCSSCNAAKGAQEIPNPATVLTTGDVWVNENGVIVARTTAARRLVRKLGLDAADYTEFRLLWINILALAKQYDAELYTKLVGYPADLPDLSGLRPAGNTRPEGVQQSSFARRAVGTLPTTYFRSTNQWESARFTGPAVP